MVVAWSVHLEPYGKHSVRLALAGTTSEHQRENAGGHLLVEESPEHGQRDVEEQNLEDHLHLRDQKFLGAKKKRRWLTAAWRARPTRGRDTHVILLLSPVHPVGSLRVLRRTVPEAVFDGKLQTAERRPTVSGQQVSVAVDPCWGGSEPDAVTRRHLRPRTCRTSPSRCLEGLSWCT